MPPPPQPRYGPNGYPPPPERHYPGPQSPTASYTPPHASSYPPPPPPPPQQGGYGGRPPPMGHHNSYPPPPPSHNPYGGPPPGHNPYGGGSAPPRQSPRAASGRMASGGAGGGGRNTPESNLRALFSGVDRNGNGTLSEAELGSALVNGDYTKFNRDTVRLMIKMFDRNGDGAIDYEEFGNLWRYLRDWRKIFDKFDLDRSGSINFDEYCRALSAFGYSLSNQCIHNMYNTYSHIDRYGDQTISFDMFVQSCINLKRITDSFKKYDTDRDGYVTLGFEQYLLEIVSLR